MGDFKGSIANAADDTSGGSFVTNGPQANAWILEKSFIGYGVFGQSLANHANAALVGIPSAPTDTGRNKVNLYLPSGAGTYAKSAEIITPLNSALDSFGAAVSLGEDFALIGAPTSSEWADGAGMVYLYQEISTYNSTTHQPVKLTASDIGEGYTLGSAISLDGELAIVSSPGAYHNSYQTGAVYLYKNLSTLSATTSQSSKLIIQASTTGTGFGSSVGLSGTTAIVGAPNAVGGETNGQGRVYVYRDIDQANATKMENQILSARDAAAGDHFGHSVAISGDYAVIGAMGDDDGAQNAGSAYLFKNFGPDNGWMQQKAKLKASDPKADAAFGTSVAVSGQNALVGAPGGTGTGAAYLYGQLEYLGGNSNEYVKITPSDSSIRSFGSTVAFHDDVFMIAAPESTRVFVGSASSLVHMDLGETTRYISGFSFNSQRNWTIGETTAGNRVILSKGDSATFSNPNSRIRLTGARSQLDVHGTLNAYRILVDQPGSKLYVGSSGVIQSLAGPDFANLVTLSNRAQLMGNGVINGRVMVSDRSSLSPGHFGAGTLQIGSLDMRPETVIHLDLGTPEQAGGSSNDLIQVHGDVWLDTQLAIDTIGAQGVYPFLQYTGELLINRLFIRSAPEGVHLGSFDIDLSKPGEIRLVYGNPGEGGLPVSPLQPLDLENPPSLLGVQYWDIGNPEPNFAIDGGGGRWNLTDFSWTSSSGAVKTRWSGGVGVFQGGESTSFIRLVQDIHFTQLYFVTPGYRIRPFNDHQLRATNDALIEVSRGEAILDANLRVGGEFMKTGPGELVLNGNANAARALTVGEGILHVGGKFTAPAQTLKQGHLKINGLLEGTVVNDGTLSGAGVIEGDVTNSGILAPGNSPGTLTIRGNYVQNSTGTLQIEVSSAYSHDTLLVEGQAILNGKLEFIHADDFSKIGMQVQFLKASEIFGDFSQIDFSLGEGERGILVQTEDGLVLQIAPEAYSNLARDKDEKSLTKHLDRFILHSDAEKRSVARNLDSLSPKQLTAAFKSISPEFYEGVLSTGVELSQSHQSLIHQHLNARRLTERVSNLPTMPKPQDAATEPTAPPTENELRWSAWTQASGMFTHGGLSLNPGENFESGTLSIGADYLLTDHSALGLFVSYQEGWSFYDHSGEMDVEAVRFGVYGTYQRDGWYANALLGGGQSSYTLERPIAFASLHRIASSEPDAWEFFTSVNLGYDLEVGNWVFGPQVSLQFSTLRFGNVHEQGAQSLDLSLRDLQVESLRSHLGARLAYQLKVNDEITLVPEVRAFWEHEFIGGNSTTARLGRDAQSTFTHHFKDPREDSVGLALGVNAQVGSRWYGSLYYNADFGRNEDTNHVISVSASYRF